jgi:hypothetical protein
LKITNYPSSVLFLGAKSSTMTFTAEVSNVIQMKMSIL